MSRKSPVWQCWSRGGIRAPVSLIYGNIAEGVGSLVGPEYLLIALWVSDTHICTHRRSIVCVRVRQRAVMRPGVDVADRLTDRRVAMTILYRETSQFIAVILFIVLVYLSVHLHVFFHSLISSSSPPSPSGWLPHFSFVTAAQSHFAVTKFHLPQPMSICCLISSQHCMERKQNSVLPQAIMKNSCLKIFKTGLVLKHKHN